MLDKLNELWYNISRKLRLNMEIKTCEEYVLAELDKMAKELEALQKRYDGLEETYASLYQRHEKLLENYYRVVEFVEGK